MKNTFLVLLLASVGFFTNCGNAPTTTEPITEQTTTDTVASTPTIATPAATIIEGVYVCPQYGFEVTIPKSWKTKQPYDAANWEVFPKTTSGYDAKQPMKLGLPIMMLPIAEWEGYVKTDFSNYPYSAGGADPMESGRNSKYVLVGVNRWQMAYEEEELIREIEGVLGTVKVVEVQK